MWHFEDKYDLQEAKPKNFVGIFQLKIHFLKKFNYRVLLYEVIWYNNILINRDLLNLDHHFQALDHSFRILENLVLLFINIFLIATKIDPLIKDFNTDEELIEVRGLLVWLRWEPEHLMFNLLIFSLTLEN